MTCLEKIIFIALKMTDKIWSFLSLYTKMIITWRSGEIGKMSSWKRCGLLFFFSDVTLNILYQTFNCFLSHDEVEGNIGICQGHQDLDNDPEGAGSPAVLTLKYTKHNNTAYHKDLSDKNNSN